MTPKLTNFLASGNPCIFLPTVEDSKAEDHVRKSLVELKFTDRELCIWKTTSGMLKYEREKWIEELPAPTGRATAEFTTAIQYIASTNKAIGIFYHVRHLLNNADVIQTIIDAAYRAKGNFSSIIFIGAYLDLPPELYNIITFCDFPLPSQEELELCIDTWVKQWGNEVKGVPKGKKERKELMSRAAMSAAGLDIFSAENAVALSVSMTSMLDNEIIQSQKEQQIKKSDVLEFVTPSVSLSEVGGFLALKKWLARRKEAFSDKAKEYGLSYPRGILLIGEGGTGKSYVCKALASYLELPLLKLDISKVFDQFVGNSENKMRLALKIAEAVSPCVLWADEIDKSFSGLASSGKTDSGVTARVLSTLLTWRQETTKPVFMVCTANDPDMMPPMVYRKGRMDEVWGVDLPNINEREEIFSIHLKRRNRSPEKFNLGALSRASEGFTGAEIEAAIEDGMFYSFSEEGAVEVTTEHILRSISETTPESSIESESGKRIKEWMSSRARPVSEEETVEAPTKAVRKLSDVRSFKALKGVTKSDADKDN